MFLKIDGIEGESKASGHEAWIEVLSGSWAEDGTGRRPNAPAPAGILTLVRRADRANARLTEACGSGRSLGDIVVHKRVGDQLEESAFGDARISACTTETRDGLRVETITLTYSKIDAPAPPAPARLGGNPDRPLIEGR
jgi:type VI protein secretion system component Hcp